MLGGDVVGWGEMLHWKGKSNQREREQGLGLSWGTQLWPLEGAEAFVLSGINRSFVV